MSSTEHISTTKTSTTSAANPVATQEHHHLVSALSGLESEMAVFKKIFDCAPDAIVVTDEQGRIVHI
jgi:PAS domain-containing protein